MLFKQESTKAQQTEQDENAPSSWADLTQTAPLAELPSPRR